MNHIKQTVTAATLAACALMGAPAMADTINFESIGSSIWNGTESFTETGYKLEVIDSAAAGPGGTGFAGAVGNGHDDFLCEIAACPAGNGSYYYLGVNDGSLKISREDNVAFRLYSADYAFLAPISNLPGYSYGKLTVSGVTTGGATVSAAFDFPELVGGYSPFLSAALRTEFGDTAFSSITISSCVYDDFGCSNPSGNQAQFALDNLVLAAVPEPQTYAMFGLGLAAIGLVARRRRSQANV